MREDPRSPSLEKDMEEHLDVVFRDRHGSLMKLLRLPPVNDRITTPEQHVKDERVFREFVNILDGYSDERRLGLEATETGAFAKYFGL